MESGRYGGGCDRVEGAQGAVTVLGLLVFGKIFSPIFRVRCVYGDVPRVRAGLHVVLLLAIVLPMYCSK